MKRDFKITEVFLNDIAGEVRGWLTIDSYQTVDRIQVTCFDFHTIEDHVAVELTDPELSAALELACAVIKAEFDFDEMTMVFEASAASRCSIAIDAQQILAKYLSVAIPPAKAQSQTNIDGAPKNNQQRLG